MNRLQTIETMACQLHDAAAELGITIPTTSPRRPGVRGITSVTSITKENSS